MLEKPLVESQELLSQPEALRRRLAKDGYLFFRGLLPPEPLLHLRREMLEICQRHGWLLPGTKLEEGRGRTDAYSGYFEFNEVYRDLQFLESFHALAHEAKLLGTLETALGGPVFPHARNIARITLPGSIKMTTPSHQDHVFIQGSREVYTVWFPVGDCPVALGGLGLARGSHQLGIFPTKEAEGTGGLCADVDENRFEWHKGDFLLGDFIMFNSLTIHKAYDNTSKDLLRLSCDFRYQPFSEPLVVWDSFRPHMQHHGWENIYKHWKQKNYQFYWHQYSLQLVPAVHPAQVQPTAKPVL
ncbi:MAG: phytanoyl-CoA dioxygenase family protein [bacterium]